MNKQQNSEVSAFLPMFQKGIWLFGILSWIFGLTDRSIALLSDGYLSAIDIVQLFTASFFFVSWIFLSPFLSLNSQSQRKVEGIQQKVEASP
ncbi:hypothetical protein [Microcoleus sp. bin38.metabat.b11b12b14.051]|uniref:hypothetical protein n=1 Tax=Microcoleus sp. bin38.metabat.b11b12b14.051 TaxID=2742709 RepID=UPI0025ED0943|nr:hypothetical protein [Microcoleus sp. bin38.metabat.b11b12b14.051]